MNSTGCPSGMATDNILLFENTPLSCDLIVPFWMFIIISSSVLKFLVALGQTDLWIRRHYQRETSSKDKAEFLCGRRLPLGALGSWYMFFGIVAFAVSTTTNYANSENGGSAFIYGLSWIGYGLFNLMVLRKFVRLGHRVVGSNARKWLIDEDRNNKLAQFDMAGMASVICAGIAMVAHTLTFCVFGLIYKNK